jgi:hypothetical protein
MRHKRQGAVDRQRQGRAAGLAKGDTHMHAPNGRRRPGPHLLLRRLPLVLQPPSLLLLRDQRLLALERLVLAVLRLRPWRA